MFSLTSGLFLINTLPFIFSKTRLVRELEKKFSGRHVVIVAQVCNVWLFLLHFIVWVFFLHPFGIQHFYDHWIKWQYSLCLWEMTVNHWAVFTTWFIWKLGGGLFSFFFWYSCNSYQNIRVQNNSQLLAAAGTFSTLAMDFSPKNWNFIKNIMLMIVQLK